MSGHAHALAGLPDDRRRFALASRLLELGNAAGRIAGELASLEREFPTEAGTIAGLGTQAAGLALNAHAHANALTKKGPTP